jgi:DNA polymerase III alpha subunit
MLKDKYGQIIYSENDLVDLYLINPILVFSRPVLVSKQIPFNQELDLDNLPKVTEYLASDASIEVFDNDCQNNWYMPDDYKNFDIAKFILDQCQTEEEIQRAGHELLLYQEREMFVLLKYLKYLVDAMRKNNIVWGVGRGSSVSSFVLFLIGVHKINSLYYGLEIEEFLK